MLVCTLGCNAWDVPTGPDARDTNTVGGSCLTLWDCDPGLVCSQSRCEPAPEDPCVPDYEYCPADASVPDALWPDGNAGDANSRDGALNDANSSDANSNDANPTDAGVTDANTHDAAP